MPTHGTHSVAFAATQLTIAHSTQPSAVKAISMKLHCLSGGLSKDISADPDFIGWTH
jgi:hypothetical protein